MTSIISARGYGPAIVGPEWSFGDKLRKIRREVASVSQAGMANILEVNPATYSAWEGGRSKPHKRLAEVVAQRIEDRFPGRVSAAWVLGYQPAGRGGEPSFLSLIGEQSEAEALLPRLDSNQEPSGEWCRAGYDDIETFRLNVANVINDVYLKPKVVAGARPWTQSVSNQPALRSCRKQTYKGLGVNCA